MLHLSVGQKTNLMSSLLSRESIEYEDFFNIIKKRFEKHNQIFTRNKQVLFKILYENDEHLSVEKIILIANENFELILNHSTVHSILSSFEILGMVDNIVVDDIKRFELVYFKQPHYHLYCQECNKVIEFESFDIHNLFMKHLNDINFKPTNFNVIINGVCDECQK